ncbi:MAG: hypothetical protein Q8R35_00930 [bacterium]|nr:hypothetical protein [bacterium]
MSRILPAEERQRIAERRDAPHLHIVRGGRAREPQPTRQKRTSAFPAWLPWLIAGALAVAIGLSSAEFGYLFQGNLTEFIFPVSGR